MVIYVADVVIAEDDNAFIESFLAKLNAMFSLKGLGILIYFLNIQVQKGDGKQNIFLTCCLEPKMDRAMPISSPAVEGTRLSSDGEFEDPTLYRSVVYAL